MGLNEFLDLDEVKTNSITEISNRVEYLEKALKAYKELDKELKDTKEQLKVAMIEYKVESWKTNAGTKFTLVADKEDEEVEYFDEDLFKEENPELYKKYIKTKTQAGKKGYVRVTLPKEE